jgi:methylenetetrahydrofolate dehydrogenase (NADP+) / methenyltetrahydrofolate cyclohydrolase / formyltetrahydrofolate synthetase
LYLNFDNLFYFRFGTDTEAELALVRELCLASGAFDAVVANHWAEGGAGAVDLGKSVIAACAAAKTGGSPFS